jgi:hypothetical protein
LRQDERRGGAHTRTRRRRRMIARPHPFQCDRSNRHNLPARATAFCCHAPASLERRV